MGAIRACRRGPHRRRGHRVRDGPTATAGSIGFEAQRRRWGSPTCGPPRPRGSGRTKSCFASLAGSRRCVTCHKSCGRSKPLLGALCGTRPWRAACAGAPAATCSLSTCVPSGLLGGGPHLSSRPGDSASIARTDPDVTAVRSLSVRSLPSLTSLCRGRCKEPSLTALHPNTRPSLLVRMQHIGMTAWRRYELRISVAGSVKPDGAPDGLRIARVWGLPRRPPIAL